jgi:hypothetical protein
VSTATTNAAERSFTDAMRLLGSGVPLTLLLDLAMGPRSDELLESERCSGVLIAG